MQSNQPARQVSNAHLFSSLAWAEALAALLIGLQCVAVIQQEAGAR